MLRLLKVASERLQDEPVIGCALGERFLIGTALYTGTRAYNLDDRLHAITIDRLWTPSRCA
jgi:hypothetical protein